MKEFKEFPKIYRVSRECVITEKIDGTNGQICITEDGDFLIGSRTRWITPENDNMGFARWCIENKNDLLKLGPGSHFGEWWGSKIQRGYGLTEKRFSLFNTSRWLNNPNKPDCCLIVPVLYTGIFSTEAIDSCINFLRQNGSVAVPGFMKPEGIVCFHIQGNFSLKKTLEKDEIPKGKSNEF